MAEENAQEKAGTEAMVKDYSTSVTQTDKEGRIYVKVSLKRNAPEAEMERITALIKTIVGKVINSNYPESYINWVPEVYGWIPFDKIQEIAEDSLITGILPVIKPVTRIGEFTTPGDTQLKAQQARTQFGVNGTGVKIGVISDGIDHWHESTSSGDLPFQLTNVNQISAGDEGTAMLEIVYDIAPGAQLYFAGAGSNPGTMESAVNLLFNTFYACKVAVDDIGWFAEPYFEDNALSQTIAYHIAANDKTYISACGNEGLSGWGGIFRDGGGWHAWEWDGSSYHTDNRVNVQPQDTLLIFLQWAEEWNNPESDYDLYVVDGFGNVKAQATGTGPHPFALIAYVHSGSELYRYIRVKKVSGQDREIKLLLLPKPHAPGVIYDPQLQFIYDSSIHNHPVNQIFGQPAAAGVISVAAYPSTNENILESYSSRGPTNIYIGATVETRDTPTITATTGCSTKVGANGYFFQPFFGTSAAAPHIAGIAALYYDKYGTGTAPENFLPI